MPAKKSSPKSPQTVEAFLADLDHPLKSVILALRESLLRTDTAIGEAIKWNAPSFHAGEHFATMHLRQAGAVQLILHLGAKKRTIPKGAIDDPQQLLTWLGPDRATLKFVSVDDVNAKCFALQVLIRRWLEYV
ncbi:DUF1801 domain-containing protein [Pseudoxanthomonas sp. UTMC 1351]|uniref:DUF1801 domain-containing protein n=1 Tax=Pseudoxanthomonas sp. UTMC 1351 TaxID=2695853 RepID=UPI0034D0185B